MSGCALAPMEPGPILRRVLETRHNTRDGRRVAYVRNLCVRLKYLKLLTNCRHVRNLSVGSAIKSTSFINCWPQLATTAFATSVALCNWIWWCRWLILANNLFAVRREIVFEISGVLHGKYFAVRREIFVNKGYGFWDWHRIGVKGQ